MLIDSYSLTALSRRFRSGSVFLTCKENPLVLFPGPADAFGYFYGFGVWQAGLKTIPMANFSMKLLGAQDQ